MATPRPLQLGDPPRLGAYLLEARLGEGGQGIVYLGRDAEGRQVAVKLLRSQLDQDEAMRSRFARELAVVERVAGFCTAQVLDADVAGDQPYIVSEYVPGPSLRQLVAERGVCEGTELDRLAIGTATALAAIHRAGIVHRDFKPANVLMGPDGPRVIDFGIARALESGAGSTTASGVVGTPSYMAPEQIAGDRVTPAADVFAWAATMAFAATGRPPFGGGSIPAVIHRITQGTPDLSGVPVALLPVLERCLAKDPAARPAAQELLLTLIDERPDPAARDEPGTGPEPSFTAPLPPGPPPPPYLQTPPPLPPRPAGGRRTALVAATAACAALALGVVAAGAWMYGPWRDAGDSLALPEGGPELLKVASADVRTVTSYDYRTLDADVRTARALMTSSLQKQYDADMTTTRKAAVQQKAVSAATVQAAGLESASGARATVLIFLDQRVTRAGGTPAVSRSQIRTTLVRLQGQWRLDQMTLLPAAPPDVKNVSWPGEQASSVLGAAQSCLRAWHSIDYRRLDSTLATIPKCTTGELRDEWTRSEARFRSATTTAQSVTRVLTTDVALSSSTGSSQATVLVGVGFEVRTKAAAPASNSTRYRATMNRVGGRWLVARLEAVN